MRHLILLLTSLTIMATPAHAGTVLTAKLLTPVAQKERLIADETLWICEESVCTAHVRSTSVSVKACQKLTAQVGPLQFYGNANRALDDEALQTCNAAT